MCRTYKELQQLNNKHKLKYGPRDCTVISPKKVYEWPISPKEQLKGIGRFEKEANRTSRKILMELKMIAC